MLRITKTSLNKLALLSLGLAAVFHLGALHASEPLSLKSSVKLGKSVSKQGLLLTQSNFQNKPNLNKTQTSTQPQLLGKMNMFRGVSVDDGNVAKLNLKQSKIELNESNSKSPATFKAVQGGLQVSLKENLSLVYTPGRLSSTTLNSESQGLYLLTNQDGLAHWFVGVESNSYSTTTDTRQTSNTAQFGIIVSLN